MAARRLADQENAASVDGVPAGVGVEPADGAEYVLVTGRRRRAADQPVVDGHGEEAQAGPLTHFDGAVRRLRFPEPAAAVNREDDREGPLAFGVGEVGQQARSLDAAVDDVLLENRLRFRLAATGFGTSRSGSLPLTAVGQEAHGCRE